MYDKFLPIGTVCLLKEAEKEIMIIGYIPKEKKDDYKIYDYMACLYPEGILNNENALVFNHNQISEIRYLGYNDIEYEKFNVEMKNLVDNLIYMGNKNDNKE